VLTVPSVSRAVSSAVEASVRRFGETEPRLHAFVHFDAENSLLMDAALEPGTRVMVVRVEGATLYVDKEM